jgi:N-acetylmuramoyl-L-alanine amidase
VGNCETERCGGRLSFYLMKVIDHWLDAAVRVKYPSGAPMRVRRCLVMHFTNGASAMSSIDFWKSRAARGAEAHVVVDRDGTIYQILPFNEQADHAGTSRWNDPNTGKRYQELNRCSIGIEFANAGEDAALAKRWSKLPPVVARHKNGGPVLSWERYTPEQIAAAKEIAKALVNHYHLDDVVGHDDIAPQRKIDPGPAFPLDEIRAGCGMVKLGARRS